MYSIVAAPNPILRTATKPVLFSGPKLEKIIAEMKQTLAVQDDPEGVGLAANQVGLPYNLFLARLLAGEAGSDAKSNSPIYVFINPQVVSHSDELQPEKEEKMPLEGCLSLPNYYGIVKRYKWIRIKYSVLSIKGTFEEKEETFSGFAAIVIQHELDHLSGKIFVERILEQNGKLYKVTGGNKKNKEVWSEVEL